MTLAFLSAICLFPACDITSVPSIRVGVKHMHKRVSFFLLCYFYKLFTSIFFQIPKPKGPTSALSMSDLVFQGVILPPGVDEINDPCDQFSKDEVDNINLVGLPVFVEHIDRSTAEKAYLGVGSVIDQRVNPADGRKLVTCRVQGDTLPKKVVQNKIRSGVFRDLSLTHQYEIIKDKTTGKLYQTKTPVEISVCETGRRPGCRIMWHSDIGTKMVSII